MDSNRIAQSTHSQDVTATLARFAAGLTYEDIPQRVRERTKDLLLDALACALAGHRGEDTTKVMPFAAALGNSQESTIIGGGRLSLAGGSDGHGFRSCRQPGSRHVCRMGRPAPPWLQFLTRPRCLRQAGYRR